MDHFLKYYPECNLKLIQSKIENQKEKIDKMNNKLFNLSGEDSENLKKEIQKEFDYQQELLLTFDKCQKI